MFYEYSIWVASFADLHLTFKLHAALPLILKIVLQQGIISYQDEENFIMGSFRICCSHHRPAFYFIPSCGPSTRFQVMSSPYGASLLPSSDTPHSERLLYELRPTQRPLPENLENSHALGGIRTRSPRKWALSEPRVKQRGNWVRRPVLIGWQC